MSTDQQLALARATRGESTHLSKAARQVVPPFLQKLYEIVNDSRNDELIRWSENGDSFYVLNHERFAREVLGRWFKHQKFTSFVRQLNMYGFHKIPQLQQGVLRSDSDTEPWHFEHPHFRRGQPDLLCLIQRKKQPTHGADEPQVDMHEPASTAAPLGNLTAGQLLDINSVVNGISAIKRHQQAISADLNELKASNQHLWQEALAARERHKKHQDTINRILKFLAGVFGHSAESVHEHSGQGDSPPRVVVPRKRQRLMISDGGMDKGKGAAVGLEGHHGNEPEHHSPSHPREQGRTPFATAQFASIETPESSVQSPSMSSSTFSPSPSDHNSGSFTHSTQPMHSNNTTSRPATLDPPKQDPSATAASSSVPAAQQCPRNDNSMASSAMTSMTTTSQSPPNNAEPWSVALQQMLSSPGNLQRLMQALAMQQNYPVSMPDPPPEFDPKAASSQVATYDPNMYDFSRYRSDQPEGINHGGDPFSTGIPAPKELDDDGPPLGPLVESADRLSKTYRDAAEIDADVDALQYSLNSLIENYGLDTNVTVTQDNPGHEGFQHVNGGNPGPGAAGGNPAGDPMIEAPPADFDFDAFLNELATRNPIADGDADYADVTAQFDPSTKLNGTTVGDASTEQLTAFLDDVSDTASLNEPLDAPPTIGRKRKSDVADLPIPPMPLDVNDPVTLAPRTKKKR